MAQSNAPNTRTLDPVVVEALTSITRWVYHRRGPRLQDKFHRYHSLLERDSRSYAIATFKHLKHAGFDFPPFLVRRWALAHGWKEPDAQLLDDYAAGVVAGVQYHHHDPVGRDAVDNWQRKAEHVEPWVDPGRPEHGATFLRRD